MPRKLYDADQNLLDISHPPIQVLGEKNSRMTLESFKPFERTDAQKCIGLAAEYSSEGQIIALAIAIKDCVLVVEFPLSSSIHHSRNTVPEKKSDKLQAALDLFGEEVLNRSFRPVFGFDLGPLTVSLFLEYGIRIASGVDIQSAATPGSLNRERLPLISIKHAIGDSCKVYDENINAVFGETIYDPRRPNNLVFRAWISYYVATLPDMEETFQNAPKINTCLLSEIELQHVGQMVRDDYRMKNKASAATNHDIKASWDTTSNQLHVESMRFQNRVTRPSTGQRLRVHIGANDGTGYVLPGTSVGIDGKGSKLDSSALLKGKEHSISSLITTGMGRTTNADAERVGIYLRILQGLDPIFSDNPWVSNIWLSSGTLEWPPSWSQPPPANPPTPVFNRPLNSSQLVAIDAMLSPSSSHHLVLVQGPPGTGKTSVIGNFVEQALDQGQSGIWLIAQSNVAVKNIAEKLEDYQITDWRLFVSREFHYSWHEHLYKKVEKNLISTEILSRGGAPLRKALLGCKVVLCTLSTLSHHKLSSVTAICPIRTLIVDEASQIEVGGYLPVFEKCHNLRKMCFIGDDKQLPPFGQEDISTLQSIFEKCHLRSQAVFLDTQYRMPPQIGDFISEEVYEGLLKSNPKHPVGDDVIACRFLDVKGTEKKDGKSFMNELECDAALKIAAHYQDAGMNYRIITPYDAQRTRIEAEMKASGLRWEDKCFNVDSFQGNEEDYIIISLVRSKELGFLKNLRRTNVMLSRCKRGMIICTNASFMKGAGKSTLAGHLAAHVGAAGWLSLQDIEAGNF